MFSYEEELLIDELYELKEWKTNEGSGVFLFHWKLQTHQHSKIVIVALISRINKVMNRSRVRWQSKLLIRKWLPHVLFNFYLWKWLHHVRYFTNWISNLVNEYVVHIILLFFLFFTPIKVYRLFWRLCESWIRWKRLWNTNLISLNYKMSLERLWKKKIMKIFIFRYISSSKTNKEYRYSKEKVLKDKSVELCGLWSMVCVWSNLWFYPAL